MATLAEKPAAAVKKRPVRRATDPFGGGVPMALLALAVTGIGFWRTFFSQLGNIDAVHMWHGATSTGWLVLVLTQASLIGSRQYKLHRILGWASVALFGSLLVSSWTVLALMLSGKGSPMPFELAKLFALSDVMALPLLVIAYVAAIVLRKDRHVHSRLISVTLLAGLLPAAARMFNRIWTGVDGLILSMHPTYLFPLAVLAAAIYVDWKNDRLRWPFPFAFAWFAVSYAILFPGWQSRWFDVVARAIAATA
jgi:uncharacterized membrane protein